MTEATASQVKLYAIANWDDQYENNRTRDMKVMQWVPVPNRHDGDGYTLLMEHKNGAALFGAWNAILQVASKCQPRGTLLRDNRHPHAEGSLSRLTRIPEAIIKEALRVLSDPEIGWLQVVDAESLTPIPHPPAGIPHPPARKGREGKGIEEKDSYGELGKVKLTKDEHSKLLAKHPQWEVEAAIEILDGYIASKNKKYDSHYAVMKSGSWVWERVSALPKPKATTNKYTPPPEWDIESETLIGREDAYRMKDGSTKLVSVYDKWCAEEAKRLKAEGRL